MNAQNGAQIFDNTFVHEININFYEADFWDTLTNNYQTYNTFSGSDIPYTPAQIEIDGVALDSVAIRLKGKSSYYYVNEKKPFKIDFNEFISGQKFDGLKKLNLQNSIGDPAMQRDLLAYQLMRDAGVPAPRVSFCRLVLNGEDWGVYKVIEQVDRTFLKQNYADDSGNLFKNQRWSELRYWGDDPLIYKDTFELKTNTTEDDWSGFINLLDVINNTDDSEFEAAIDQVFNVDQYLHVLAVDVMTNNWDSYISNARNWYLYEEPSTGKFNWIPWDYNLSFGGEINFSGNPYPPYDPDCIIKIDFQFHKDGNTVFFTENSTPQAEIWSWDFGDGTFSADQNPSHAFAEAKPYNVCLTSSTPQGSEYCSQTRCVRVDMSYNPGDCPTIQNGDCPYPPEDPIFQQVIANDSYCCETDWDAFCYFEYQELMNAPPPEIVTGTEYNVNYPILLDNPDKVLVDRLLAVPAYRERYLDICCLLLDNHFNEEQLFPKIDYFGGLLRDEILSDPRYNFATDYFEYDTGNGTGGGVDADIPALKFFLNQRFGQLEDDMQETQHDCSDAYSTISWNDIVINEFIASNTEANGQADSNGEYDDWIEFYNNSTESIDLSNLYISDDVNFKKKWSFPENTILSADSYLIVWADKDIDQEGLHASFSLSKAGESIVLSHDDGTLIDIYTFGEQFDNIASARIPNGVGPFVAQNTTFNANNDDVVSTTNRTIETKISLFPNPVSQHLLIEMTGLTPGTLIDISISNVLGKKLYMNEYEVAPQVKLDFDFKQLASGCYFIQLESKQQKSIHKFTVLHE